MMSDKLNPHDLVGGFASSTLSQEERRKLFNAALDDQVLFDELLNDEPLREILSDAATRSRLLTALSDDRLESGWFGAKWSRQIRRLTVQIEAAATQARNYLLSMVETE